MNKNRECSFGKGVKIFVQEDINFTLLDQAFMTQSFDVIKRLDKYPDQPLKIPLISHQVYFSSINNSKMIDKVSTQISVDTFITLNKANRGWAHYIWTNNLEIIPDIFFNLKNIEVRLVDEFNDSSLWDELNIAIQEAEYNHAKFAQASDIMRYMALERFGGIYRDLDYRIYNAVNLIKLMTIANFLSGKETIEPNSFIANFFIAASQNHPIINNLISIIERNLNQDKFLDCPEYIKYPCTLLWKIVYETGPVPLTVAFFNSSNLNNNIDLVMTNAVFCHTNYLRMTTPDSRCYNPNLNVSLTNIIDGAKIETIGADMLCGSWYDMSIINYGENISNLEYREDQLFEASLNGNIHAVIHYSINGENIDKLDSYYNVTPIYAAVIRNNTDVVSYLLSKIKDINFIYYNGHTILSVAVQYGYTIITNLLLEAGSNSSIITENSPSLKEIALMKGYSEIYTLIEEYELKAQGACEALIDG